MATYLNAGLWGSRFIGDCEVSTNGETVWVKGRRAPVWMAFVRVVCYVAFLPVGFYTGVLLGETLVGHWGYPPYYYLVSALLSFLLVVLGLWGAGIWKDKSGSYEVVSWPASKVGAVARTSSGGAVRGHAVWKIMNTFLNVSGLIQVQVPIGPGGKPRRLVLKVREAEAASLLLVLSGAYYGSGWRDANDATDPWRWSRN